MSENEDFESLKVLELQNELKKRGLDTKGRKAELIDRLRQAVNNGTEANDPTIEDSTHSDEESSEAVMKDDTLSPANDNKNNDDEPEETSVEPNPEAMEEQDAHHESPASRKRRLTDDDIEKVKENDENEENSIDNQNKLEKDDESNATDDLSKLKRKKKSRWGSEQDEESSEKQSTTKQTSDDDDDDDDENDDTIDNNNSSRHRERDHDRDYHRSSKQRDDDRHYSSRHSEKSTEREIPLPEEETVQFNNDDVVLDFYTSDLNVAINTDCLSASSKSNDALCFLWAGVRASYGFKQGKICYAIRITDTITCPQMPDSEKEKFGIRVGWSNLSSGLQALQLGEFNDSFAYTSSGKKMSKTNDELIEESYGEAFGLSDVLGCYIDFGDNSEDNLIRISFTKNEEDYGQAFEFSKTNLNEFYPHILVKNAKFECNFGQLEQPWFAMKPDYTFPQQVPLENRTRCSEPVLEKSNCQVVLLSGLNGSGKTTWAKKYMEENSKQHFNLLDAEYVLSKMTIDGKSPTVKDRNDGVMLRVNIGLQKLIDIAAQRRRNYIIDHVNTTRDSQSKRQRLFTGYHRIGVVIVPDDDELKRRIEKLEKSENISIPSQWIKEAKAKFHFPQKGSSLEDVIYPELSYDDAKTLYDKARRDYDQHRSSSSSSSRYDRHDDYHSSRNNNRNRYDDREHRSRDRDRDRDRDRYARSRSRDRDRDRRTSRDDTRFSSSHRNDNYRGGGGGGGGSGFSRGGNGRYSDHRQDSRSNQRSGFHEGGGNNYRGRGNNFGNQSNDDRRGGYHQRNDFNSGRGRGGFDNNRNQYNSRGSFHDNQRGGSSSGGGGGFRQDFNNPQRRQFNDYDNNHQQSQGGGRGFIQNNNSFNQQHDRQGFGSRPPMQQQQPPPQQQQQQHSFHNPQQQQQQRLQPLIQTLPSNQQQFPSHLTQATNNPNLSLSAQNSLNVNQMSNPANVSQQSALDPWLALCAAALNTQPTAVAAPQQPQQDTNSLTQQWAQWLKTAQMAQTAQQAQPQLTVQQADSHHQQHQQQQQQAQMPDASALYYQAYYAQLAAAQQQAAAAAAAAGSSIGGVAPPSNNDK
ncbi:unnamed protein product [Rotaria magnacalcarata]|uniref:Uncharacterized protein n=1 Tax=Rotaria magnacalcarata TaxID=392030 RepID=A0A816DT94_9BILA|nr:unnamed protein product [Rotaria magnacalcarata]CAF1637035.1 unnamed protein product [Rotaria magnacalcarata]